MSKPSHSSLIASSVALTILAVGGATAAGFALAQASIPAPTPATPALPATPANPPMQTPQAPTVPGSSPGSASGAVNSPLAEFDANADGKLSRDELSGNASLSSRFKSLDTNQDGYLSSMEYPVAGTAATESTRPKRK